MSDCELCGGEARPGLRWCRGCVEAGTPRPYKNLWMAQAALAQGGLCAVCGSPFASNPRTEIASADRIVPGARGGGYTRENIRALHLRCNSARGKRTDETMRRKARARAYNTKRAQQGVLIAPDEDYGYDDIDELTLDEVHAEIELMARRARIEMRAAGMKTGFDNLNLRPPDPPYSPAPSTPDDAWEAYCAFYGKDHRERTFGSFAEVGREIKEDGREYLMTGADGYEPLSTGLGDAWEAFSAAHPWRADG